MTNKKPKPKILKSEIRERRNRNMLKAHNITIEEYERMCQKRKGCCDICQRKTKLEIDRNGGLLCRKCRVALNWFDDSLDRLQLAKIYLQKHEVNLK